VSSPPTYAFRVTAPNTAATSFDSWYLLSRCHDRTCCCYQLANTSCSQRIAGLPGWQVVRPAEHTFAGHTSPVSGNVIMCLCWSTLCVSNLLVPVAILTIDARVPKYLQSTHNLRSISNAFEMLAAAEALSVAHLHTALMSVPSVLSCQMPITLKPRMLV
jgi:hypothetical protein